MSSRYVRMAGDRFRDAAELAASFRLTQWPDAGRPKSRRGAIMDDKEVYVNELTREFCSGDHRIGWVDCGYD